MSKEDLAPSKQEALIADGEGNTSTPQEVENTVESAAPEESGEAETGEQKPQDNQPGAEKGPEIAEDEIEVSIEGEESPPDKESAPAWVKELRKEHRDLKAKNAELERALKTQSQTEQIADLGPKPTLDSCDFDAEEYEKKLESWHARRQEVSRIESQRNVEIENQRRAWGDRVQTYARMKEELAKQIPTFSEAESYARSILDLTQQSVIVAAADNPALVVCALGQNPKLAQDLSNEKDPIRFAFKVAKLEARLKTTKKTAPPPEKPIKGSGSAAGSTNTQLERLREEAAKTGDYTKVLEYKNRAKRDKK